jgi:cell division protein FtsX
MYAGASGTRIFRPFMSSGLAMGLAALEVTWRAP